MILVVLQFLSAPAARSAFCEKRANQERLQAKKTIAPTMRRLYCCQIVSSRKRMMLPGGSDLP